MTPELFTPLQSASAHERTYARDASPGKSGTVRLGSEPGSQWQYSGGGFTLLQLVIEEVSGEPFAQYMDRAVFDPLGMERTTFDHERALELGLAQNFRPDRTVEPFRWYTALAATSEAVVMAVKAGIDPGIAVDVINVGSGRNSASQDKFPNAIIPRKFDYGFATGLMYKDLRLCMDEAEALGVQMWVGNSVKQLWQLVNSQIGPQSDFTQIVEVPERWAGVQVGEKKD